MGRWTQYDEDSYRLPEGMTRVGYDADSSNYTFRDTNGNLYQSAPGARYGVLEPVSASTHSEPADKPRRRPTGSQTIQTRSLPQRAPTTFHEILPPELIASPSSAVSASPSKAPSPPKESIPRFVQAVRRTALPKMQGVVRELRRSATSARKVRQPQQGEESERLLRRSLAASWDSSGSSSSAAALKRSQSLVTPSSKTREVHRR